MRRAASLRSHTRSATTSSTVTTPVDELGVVREESGDEGVRKELLAAQRDNDKLRDQILALQTMLAQRPSLEQVQELKKEYSNLDLILQGTQRENERCMAELERAKQREKVLEGHLTKLVGENWQTMVGIAVTSAASAQASRASLGGSPSRKGTQEAPIVANSPDSPVPTVELTREAKMAQLEQIRMLVLGMDQRLQTREEALNNALTRAESQSAHFDALVKELDVGSS
ncbi:hypothetical protein EXIGLDRAFT_619986 [Exidia glandulosa HHB12029]|uniref:Uncharacterized protein n=1 Tax=Exidia glandulosa HHB12029 TaxID=1314781 RepID=A0A165EYF4_EXIGL|nr:hypothetical protein EXIGLDRAFT_619986 [Exidia glandulosa HHB12029]